MELKSLDTLANSAVRALEAEAAPTTRVLVIVTDGETTLQNCAPFTLGASQNCKPDEAKRVLVHVLQHLAGVNA